MKLNTRTPNQPRSELRAAWTACKPSLRLAVVFSSIVNLLALTGPMFMLFIYDRVLPSGSYKALAICATFALVLFLCMGVQDYARGRLLANMGWHFFSTLQKRVFSATISATARQKQIPSARRAMYDLKTLQNFISSGPLIALLDIPWSVFFLTFLYYLHPWLGHFALFAGGFLMVITALHQKLTKPISVKATKAAQLSDFKVQEFQNGAQTVVGLGMEDNCYANWITYQNKAAQLLDEGAKWSGLFKSWTLATRQILQSATLALGAVLVIDGEITAGAMIASSILMSRVLTPIETAINGWPSVVAAQKSFQVLSSFLQHLKMKSAKRGFPPPIESLVLNNVTISESPVNKPRISNLSFKVSRGQALGVIGHNGSGKSTLANFLAGVGKASRGYAQIDDLVFSSGVYPLTNGMVGYLPQDVRLFTGTIAENISRFSPSASSQAVIKAANLALVHDCIMSLPKGYETPISSIRKRLSQGELQRIGLARAIFDNPSLIVLDEPNAHLDHAGIRALNGVIKGLKDNGKIVVVMAQRPSAIDECDLLLELENGYCKSFGNRNALLKKWSANSASPLAQSFENFS